VKHDFSTAFWNSMRLENLDLRDLPEIPHDPTGCWWCCS